MALTPSTMRDLGTIAPDFALPDCKGKIVTRKDFTGKPLLVVFISNHCPYVKHIGHKLGELAGQYAERGMGAVLINSNNPDTYPEDAQDKMPGFAREYGITVPYLYDANQEIAKAYKAACTPDFFLFDKQHKLVYRGQFDDSRPGGDAPVSGADLSAAADAVLAGKEVSAVQKPSMGCNIKWIEGKEPDYYSG
ncbi:MAG: thioredoxin family protein [Spirochaeta sp. LUC14_002_19_P3]|nr:MAG: thioredoxin family protein [Spirochaeta sp. LUC14_002_19_P3]